ncbi:MAG: Holliday junction resolvase RuvX [Clostridiales bacterium]|nr:Holliday junction resolvase RuvX [Clostridiales bacterium]
MRILAMDVGDRRIGMAVSDIMGWTAQGIETLERRNDKYDIEKIAKAIDLYNPEKIVLGLPRNMNGTIGPQGEKVKEFGQLLKEEVYKGEIIYWDERLTSVLANRIMIDADLSRRKRKKNVDMMAAVFILQSYLDYINNQKKGE